MDTTTDILCKRIRSEYLYNPKAFEREVAYVNEKPLALFKTVEKNNKHEALRRRLEEAEKIGEIKRRFK